MRVPGFSKRSLRFAAAAGTLLLAAAAAFLTYVHLPLPIDHPTTLEVPRGASLRPILDTLTDRGLLRSPNLLYLYARLRGLDTIRAGSYDIEPGLSGAKLLETLHAGRVRLDTVGFPEGANRWQVRDLLVREGWLDAAAFDRLCDDEAWLDSRGVPGPTCEGYLYPDTYKLARGLPPEEVLGAMLARFLEVYAEVVATGRGPMHLEMRDLVTLASIVEKETGAPEERPRIACVFYNRLMADPPWKLQTDPTVIYAARLRDPGFDGNLTRWHLREMHHPYNTYLVGGLPPGPIANPGRDALEAVVHPARCRDFFFVSMNNGRHRFCPDLECHNRAVARYQRRRRAP